MPNNRLCAAAAAAGSCKEIKWAKNNTSMGRLDVSCWPVAVNVVVVAVAVAVGPQLRVALISISAAADPIQPSVRVHGPQKQQQPPPQSR